jgi:hypothetical protein
MANAFLADLGKKFSGGACMISLIMSPKSALAFLACVFALRIRPLMHVI